MMSANKITLAEFKAKLGKYPDLIKNYNKPAKEGQLSLEQLDKFRYIEAPSQFSKKAGGKSMELADIRKLVDWKIRHGTFRPTLPKLVASNKEENVKSILTDAFELYAKDPSDIKSTITKIAELKGIGPATASLVLSVHDPEHVIFFEDEAYRWLVHDGETVVLKYNFAEFDELYIKAKALSSKLKVSPLDIEKVAFVIMKENEPDKVAKPKEPSGMPRGRPRLAEHEKKPKKAPSGLGRGRPKGSGTNAKAPSKISNGTGKGGRPAGVSAEVKGEEVKDEKTNLPAQNPVNSAKRKAMEDAPQRASAKKAKA